MVRLYWHFSRHTDTMTFLDSRALGGFGPRSFLQRRLEISRVSLHASVRRHLFPILRIRDQGALVCSLRSSQAGICSSNRWKRSQCPPTTFPSFPARINSKMRMLASWCRHRPDSTSSWCWWMRSAWSRRLGSWTTWRRISPHLASMGYLNLTYQLALVDIAVTLARILRGEISDAYKNGIRKSPMGKAARAMK